MTKFCKTSKACCIQATSYFEFKDSQRNSADPMPGLSLMFNVTHIGHTEKEPWFNPTALNKAKIVCNFGLSVCNRVNVSPNRHEEPGIKLGTPKLII